MKVRDSNGILLGGGRGQGEGFELS